MRYTNDSHVTNLDEVRDFFSYLINDLKVSIHPDTDFSEYVKVGTNKQTFTDEESTIGNRLMDECFNVCGKQGMDIYELCLPILQKATFGEDTIKDKR